MAFNFDILQIKEDTILNVYTLLEQEFSYDEGENCENAEKNTKLDGNEY